MKVVEVEYGRYLLKAGVQKNGALGRAFIRAKQGAGILCEVKAKTPDLAIEALKQALDETDRAARKNRRRDEKLEFDVPTVAEYQLALSKISPDGSYRSMLEAHARAGREGLTAGQLAEAAGYANFNAANLHYGKLGREVADFLGVALPASTARPGEDVATGVLAGIGPEEGIFVWVMRPELRAALGYPE
ncbi:hypothetical protein GE300_03230 [Rhodobacteraceae bacterium 2CG4]|uniref:Uncharacterized protein n=1 Tax=Halovulum marinum TaxID=2662447 RepID=A0A6L5YXN7_9RHOB|nr:hypothetical protein [Halovulum marinum]MSU88632.1 hypothetical protein [Halovulum marinum]